MSINEIKNKQKKSQRKRGQVGCPLSLDSGYG